MVGRLIAFCLLDLVLVICMSQVRLCPRWLLVQSVTIKIVCQIIIGGLPNKAEMIKTSWILNICYRLSSVTCLIASTVVSARRQCWWSMPIYPELQIARYITNTISFKRSEDFLNTNQPWIFLWKPLPNYIIIVIVEFLLTTIANYTLLFWFFFQILLF